MGNSQHDGPAAEPSPSEERRALAEEATGVGDFALELPTSRLFWSPAIFRLHGLAPDVPPSIERWRATLHPDDRARIAAVLAALREAPPSPAGEHGFVENEYRVVLPDGGVRWIASRVRVLAGADGRAERVVGVNFDVTERKRAEEALREAEAAEWRVAFLADASATLAGSLDFERTLRTVAELAVPSLADWCFVEIREPDGTVRPAAVVHRDPEKVALGFDVMRRYPIDLEAPFGTGHVLRTGEPELVPEIPDAALAAVAQDAEHLALLRGVGFRSSLSVPLAHAGEPPLGVLSFVAAESERRYGPADLAMAQEVARRAAAALTSARLFATSQATLRRTTALQHVTGALSGALTPEAAAAVVVEEGVAALAAQSGVVLRLSRDGTALEVVRSVGYPEELVADWRRIPLDLAVPLTHATTIGEPVFVESDAAWAARYPAAGIVRRLPGSQSWAVLPLAVRGRVLGAMGFSFQRERPFGAEDRAFMVALAQQCAQAFERARLFAAERAARAEAERANQAKGEFLAVMSHELRTPLNAIGGYAELLAMGIRGPVTEQQREDLERIQRSQKHLLGLINEVLNYARLETGTVRYDVTDVGVAGVVGAVESLVLPQVRERSLTLDTSACGPRVIVRADAEKLRQILLNLLSNAVKFTDAGGRITVACRDEPQAAHGPAIAITVQDTGVGIPHDQIEAVFEPFVQVGRALNNPSEGTGLGLAISRDLARGMGGDLTATSQLGVGSTFTLTLPRA